MGGRGPHPLTIAVDGMEISEHTDTTGRRASKHWARWQLQWVSLPSAGNRSFVRPPGCHLASRWPTWTWNWEKSRPSVSPSTRVKTAALRKGCTMNTSLVKNPLWEGDWLTDSPPNLGSSPDCRRNRRKWELRLCLVWREKQLMFETGRSRQHCCLPIHRLV